MATTSELVDKGNIPEERKDYVKKLLHELGFAASRAVGKALLHITKKHMTDAGMSIADASAILAEVESIKGELSRAESLWHSFCGRSNTILISPSTDCEYFPLVLFLY